jgi:uncharacterized protein
MNGDGKDARDSGALPEIPEAASHGVPERSLAGSLLAFGRLLKEYGFSVSPPAVMDCLRAVSMIGVEDPRDFKEVLMATFLSRREELPIFDRLFDEFWFGTKLEEEPENLCGAEEGSPGPDEVKSGPSDEVVIAETGISQSPEQETWIARPHVMYSPAEILKLQDFKDVPREEDPRMARLIREMLAPLIRRKGMRKRPVNSGSTPDFRRIFRRSVRHGGQIYELPMLKPKLRMKKLVFLCDVSGSMNSYLRFMLRFIKEIHQLPTKVETFTFATSLHRITHFLSRLSFDRALQEIARVARDWSGGTRIGACLHEFRSYGQGAFLGPSSVVLIFSDGWDRGDPDLLEKEMVAIQRRSYRLLWINPLLGGPAYEPTCRGMKTALPHVDSFLPGHNLAALERLAGTLRSLL